MVGVPETVPVDGSIETPGGQPGGAEGRGWPSTTSRRPPTANGVIAAPETPDWSPGSVTVTVLTTVQANETSAEKPESSVAVIVTVVGPGVVGVPEMVPVDGSTDSPGGSVPESVNVSTASGNESVVGTGTGVMAAPEVDVWSPGSVIVNVLVTVQVKEIVDENPASSAAVTVTAKVPAMVGVPETVPVEGSIERPGGQAGGRVGDGGRRRRVGGRQPAGG